MGHYRPRYNVCLRCGAVSVTRRCARCQTFLVPRPKTRPRATHIAGYVPPKGWTVWGFHGRLVLPLQ